MWKYLTGRVHFSGNKKKRTELISFWSFHSWIQKSWPLNLQKLAKRMQQEYDNSGKEWFTPLECISWLLEVFEWVSEIQMYRSHMWKSAWCFTVLNHKCCLISSTLFYNKSESTSQFVCECWGWKLYFVIDRWAASSHGLSEVKWLCIVCNTCSFKDIWFSNSQTFLTAI